MHLAGLRNLRRLFGVPVTPMSNILSPDPKRPSSRLPSGDTTSMQELSIVEVAAALGDGGHHSGCALLRARRSSAARNRISHYFRAQPSCHLAWSPRPAEGRLDERRHGDPGMRPRRNGSCSGGAGPIARCRTAELSVDHADEAGGSAREPESAGNLRRRVENRRACLEGGRFEGHQRPRMAPRRSVSKSYPRSRLRSSRYLAGLLDPPSRSQPPASSSSWCSWHYWIGEVFAIASCACSAAISIGRLTRCRRRARASADIC